MRHHNWHWTNSRPEILYPFPCEGPNRHAKPQENALTYQLLIFVTCYLLQVCHFNWFGRLEDFPINQCGSLKHLVRLVPAKMLRSGQIVKAALGFFALKSQRMLTVRAWFWCFEIWVSWKDKRILILQSLNHMTHACWSCNKPPKDKNSLFCWGWPIWLFILRSAMVPSVHWDISKQILLSNKKSWSGNLWSGLCWHVWQASGNYLTSLWLTTCWKLVGLMWMMTPHQLADFVQKSGCRAFKLAHQMETFHLYTCWLICILDQSLQSRVT